MMLNNNVLPERRAFSLMEVVLAVGVISIAVVALLGLLAPTVSSVRHIVDKDKALRLDGIVRSYIEEDLDYSGAGSISTGLSGGDMILYVWEEQDNALSGDAVETKISDTYNPTNLIGLPHVVKLSQITIGTGTGYDYGNAANEGYIPFRVQMYQLERSALANGGTATDADLTDNRLIFDYPSAKLQ